MEFRGNRKLMLLPAIGIAAGALVGGKVFKPNNPAEQSLTITTTEQPMACTGEQIDAWQTPPNNLDAEKFAQDLGVSANQISNGVWGPAFCPEGVSVNDMDTTPLVIKGIGNVCITVGFGSSSNPQPRKKYKEILAVCAASKDTV